MTAGYTYNGNGQRVKKVVNGTTAVFHYNLYNLAGQIIAESNQAGSITAEYVYLNGQPLAKIESSNVYYYHNDHLATPQKMTDSSGTVVWAADYKPFGKATITVTMQIDEPLSGDIRPGDARPYHLFVLSGKAKIYSLRRIFCFIFNFLNFFLRSFLR